MQIVPRDQVLKDLRAFCAKHDTLTLAAKKLGITLSQLSQALRNTKSVIPAKALKKLGYTYKPVYVDTRKPAKTLPSLPASLAKPVAKKPAKKAPAKKHVPGRATGEQPDSRMAGDFPEHPTPRHGRTADDVVREAIDALPDDDADTTPYSYTEYDTSRDNHVDPDAPVAL
jgi:hypothetical protein